MKNYDVTLTCDRVQVYAPRDMTPTLYPLDRKNSANQSLQGILVPMLPLWVSSAHQSVYITSVT
eukprot:2685287-Rhodomonas_salina.1